jgi:GT2 family glycosyltransferase
LGIAESRAPLLAFTDIDTVPDPRWLELGYRRFQDPGVNYLAGGITIPVGERPSIAALVDATTFLDQEAYVATGYAAGANFWVRREIVERCGGFNQELEHYGGDDEEFGSRLTLAGASPVYAPEVHLRHPPRIRLGEIATKAYRLGYSHAARRRISTGALSGQRPLYRQPRNYVPRRPRHQRRRVEQLDYVPTVVERVAMHLARYICMQLVLLAGDYAGERQYRRARSDTTP